MIVGRAMADLREILIFVALWETLQLLLGKLASH